VLASFSLFLPIHETNVTAPYAFTGLPPSTLLLIPSVRVLLPLLVSSLHSLRLDEAQTPTAEEKAQARRAQVRKAQTEHRQRKVNYVKKLELDVNRLRDAIAEAEVDVAKLRKENAEMKSGLASIDPETAWKNKPLPSLPGMAEGGTQPLDDLGDLGDLADLDLNAFDFSLPLDSASISSGDMLACLGMDDTMQKPCYRIASSPSRSLPTSSGSPWTFPNSPPLSTQKEDLAINFILA